jgi:tetraacyldisaccharide 4'-kinase
MTLGARVARSLEAGRGGLASALGSRVWAAAASDVSRPLTFPVGAKIIAVGGSTLGGSGKTPLAVACAKQLAEDGEPVVLVGHAYRASPGYSRVVTPDDDVRAVGDEALMCARALAPSGTLVVVGPTRQAALDHALRLARVAVLDGVAQLRPARAHLALLALDAARPWGAGACPPRGDLRASKGALLAASDRIVLIGRALPSTVDVDRPTDVAVVQAAGAWLAGSLLSWDELRSRRVGLWTAIARADRVLEGLAREGIIPLLVAAQGNHLQASPEETARAVERARDARVDLWLTTAKCVTRLPGCIGDIPVAMLAYEVSLGESLVQALRRGVRAAA